LSRIRGRCFIPTNNLNHALDKDIVKVYVYNRRKKERPEGEVIEVIERNKTDFVGNRYSKEFLCFDSQSKDVYRYFYSKR
jgi:exoribonuclease R